MHTGSGSAARPLLRLGLVALALLAACAPPGPELSVRFARSALLVDASRLEIRFYAGGSDCPFLRDQRPRREPIFGEFTVTLDASERRAGTVWESDAIAAGMYAVLVDAIDADGRPTGSGCTPDGEVRDRETSVIEVVITDS
jgi:hypothetical protein